MQISTEEKKSAYDENAILGKGIYLLMESFHSAAISKVIKFILAHNFSSNGERLNSLKLIICSPGGFIAECFALIDTMKGSAIPIHTVGLGEICSAGLLTFIAGEKGERVITPNTSIMSHQFAWGSFGKEHELFATVKEFENTRDRMIEHYKKCTGLSRSKIREILLPPQDVWLDAKDAVKYGIADKIKTIY